jgi:hypothetical protein
MFSVAQASAVSGETLQARAVFVRKDRDEVVEDVSDVEAGAVGGLPAVAQLFEGDVLRGGLDAEAIG